MAKIFGDFDLSTFWQATQYSRKTYVGPAVTDISLKKVERELGYKLPLTYIEMMRFQNGGMPVNTCHKIATQTSWAPDHIAIHGVYAVAFEPGSSLCGSVGSKFYIREWGYPPIGVYFADCPSAGHDMLCLDYRSCGRDGEPSVVHVDQELDYAITFVAPSFQEFVRGLRHETEFD